MDLQRASKFIPTKNANYDGIEAAGTSAGLDQVVIAAGPGLRLERAGLVHANGQRALARRLARRSRRASASPSSARRAPARRRCCASSARRCAPAKATCASAASIRGSSAPARCASSRARIGVVHQSPPIPPRLRVVTAVLAGRLGRWSTWQSLASLLLPRDAAGARDALAAPRPRRARLRSLRPALGRPAAARRHRPRALPAARASSWPTSRCRRSTRRSPT